LFSKRLIIFLSTFLILITLIGTIPAFSAESMPASQTTDDANGSLRPKITIKEEDLPIFPEKNRENIKKWLTPALDPYKLGDFETALQETKRLLESAPDGPRREVALFLKGDIYLKLAGDGDADFLQAAATSFQEANIAYPDSENSARGLWKIGEISSRLGLHYESIASYKRILSKFPNSSYAPKAHLGIAHTYQVWERWKDALSAYSKLNPSTLSPEDRPLAVLGLAETLYYSQDFPHAYMIYTTGLNTFEPYFSQQSLTLYHFGDSAFQTGHRKEAKEIFLRFYNIFPRDPLTLMVLSRLVNIFYLEEDGKEVSDMNEIIQSLYPGPLGTKITNIMNEIEEIKTEECLKKSRKHGLESFIIQKCSEGDPKQIKAPHDEMKEVGDMVESILQEPPQSPTVQQFVFQEGEQFLRLNMPLLTFEVNKRLYPFIEPSPFQRDVLIALNKSAVEAVNKEYQAGRDLRVVELYFSAPEFFSGKIIFGPTGFKIASSLIRQGFYSQALPILETSMNSTSLSQMEEALYLYAKTLAETGETGNAGKKLEYFLKKYPNSLYRSDLIESMGNLLYKTRKYNLAIEKYKLWLSLFASSPNSRRISIKLASSYDRNLQYREAVPVYLQLLQKEPHSDPSLYLKLGDNYFQIKAYKEAIVAYENGLREKGDKKSADWIRFRIAKCYEATGQKKKGRELFTDLAKNAEDPIIKAVATEKTSSKYEVKK
jgi:tetratricopeptide (TPR) repeat protein